MNAWEAKQIADRANLDKEFKYWLGYFDYIYEKIEDVAKKGSYRIVFNSKYPIEDAYRAVLETLGYKVRVLKNPCQFEVSWSDENSK